MDKKETCAICYYRKSEAAVNPNIIARQYI